MVSTSDVTSIHHLPSFWDDSSDAKLQRQFQRSPPKRKTSPKPKHDEYTPPSSPEADASFKTSTLSYLESPRRALELPDTLAKDIPRAGPNSNAPVDSGDPRDAVNTENRSSILNASWPRPPTNTPTGPSPTSSTYSTHSPVPSSSPSVRVSFGRSPSSPTAAYLSESPFQGSGVPATPPPTPPPKSILKPVRRPSNSGSIRRPMGAREGNYGLRPEDVIYMSVVHETSAS